MTRNTSDSSATSPQSSTASEEGETTNGLGKREGAKASRASEEIPKTTTKPKDSQVTKNVDPDDTIVVKMNVDHGGSSSRVRGRARSSPPPGASSGSSRDTPHMRSSSESPRYTLSGASRSLVEDERFRDVMLAVAAAEWAAEGNREPYAGSARTPSKIHPKESKERENAEDAKLENEDDSSDTPRPSEAPAALTTPAPPVSPSRTSPSSAPPDQTPRRIPSSSPLSSAKPVSQAPFIEETPCKTIVPPSSPLSSAKSIPRPPFMQAKTPSPTKPHPPKSPTRGKRPSAHQPLSPGWKINSINGRPMPDPKSRDYVTLTRQLYWPELGPDDLPDPGAYAETDRGRSLPPEDLDNLLRLPSPDEPDHLLSLPEKKGASEAERPERYKYEESERDERDEKDRPKT